MTKIENRQTAVFIEKYYQSLEEFENLNGLHKFITVLISIITLGMETKNTIAKYRVTELKLAFEHSDSQCSDAHQKLWENFLNNHRKIKDIVQAIAEANNIEDFSQDCSLFFEEYKKKMKLKLNDDQAVFLFKKLREMIQDINPIHSTYSLPANKVLRVYKTKGDGSCAFHALIGKREDGVYQCNEKEARKLFCDYLKNSFEKEGSKAFEEGGRLELIGSQLVSYLIDNGEAPDKFKSLLASAQKRRVVYVFEAYLARYKELDSLWKQTKSDPLVSRRLTQKMDEIKNSFKNDECVFQAYLDYIGTDKVHLSSDELTTAADCLNKRLFYIERSQELQEVFPENPKNKLFGENAEKVYVVYSEETKHYERAKIIDKRDTKD